ncbi:hypothetical protein ACV334_33835, partial [Pseudomonas aeruginosa]
METQYGRKRESDQSLRKKHHTCLFDVGPSVGTVKGGKLRKRKALAQKAQYIWKLPEPVGPRLEE